ncbi:MAG: hypothetical protein RIQ94_198 [Pseudomonadota bacterium]|jgi:DNA-binding ferritin-like protein
MELLELATLFKIIDLYAHHAHNLAKGDMFMQDHAFFAEVYSLADSSYDSLIERHIGTVGPDVDLCRILKQALDVIDGIDMNFYVNISILLNESLDMIEKMCKSGSMSMGTQNLIQGQADQVEVLIYKIKRRLR